MGGDGFGEGFEVVTAFEGGDDAAVAVVVGKADDELRDLGEVVFVEVNVTEGIGGVGIEAGGDENELRTEGRERRPDILVEGFTPGRAASAGHQRYIDDIAI